MNRECISVGAVILVTTCLAGAAANAEEIKVLAVGALRSSLTELIPQFENSFKHTVKIEYGAAGAMVTRVQKGEAVDVAIATPPQIESLVTENKIVAGTQVNIAKVGIGIAAFKGAAKADISSMDAFKRTLLAAKSIGHTDPKSGASSAIYAAQLLAKLDISSELRAKIHIFESNAKLFEALSKGDVELGFGQMTEIAAEPNVVFVGMLPTPIQNYSVFAAGVVASAKAPDAAKDFVHYLTSSNAMTSMKAKGVESP
jgi:molybdate transport system substrate-binding protein